jgi:hypothetical protein
MHYLTDGTVECRVLPEDEISQETCNKLIKSRFPTFIDFYNWCIQNGGEARGVVDLSSLESLPEGVSFPMAEWVDLSSLELLPEGVSFPMAEWVDLSSQE